MTSRHEIRVPDLGDFEDVEIVEVMVAVGDHVSMEDPLITLETDKAAMEVPSTAEGVIAELPVATGMRVSQGDLIVIVEGSAVNAAPDEGVSDDALPVEEGAAKAVAVTKLETVQVFVPDLGDFPEAEIIEVQAQVGDFIAVDDPVITLETDKAAMDVPSTVAGKITSVAVKVGERIRIRIIADTRKVGHTFPTGPLEVIQAWMDVRVFRDGKEVFKSGDLDERGFIRSGSWMFKAEGVDRAGRVDRLRALPVRFAALHEHAGVTVLRRSRSWERSSARTSAPFS